MSVVRITKPDLVIKMLRKYRKDVLDRKVAEKDLVDPMRWGALIGHIVDACGSMGLIKSQADEARRLVAGLVFGDSMKPLEPMSFALFTQSHKYPFSRWISPTFMNGKWFPRAEFPLEFAWLVHRAFLCQEITRKNETSHPILLHTALSISQSATFPDRPEDPSYIEVDPQGMVAEAIRLGAIVRENFVVCEAEKENAERAGQEVS